ncbi:MAG: VOC family protein [Nitriliruptorales bacterium]
MPKAGRVHADRIDARPDHVAVALPDPDRAAARWRDVLGGGLVNRFDNEVFCGHQYRYPNQAKIELLGPSPADHSPDNFLRAFIARFGTRVHHMTLRVGSLHRAIGVLEGAGLDVVDVRDDTPHWREGFLRPSQVGGLIVQIAETPRTDDEWAEVRGGRIEEAAPGAALLLGPRLRHPDLGKAKELWSLLGGEVGETTDGLLVIWPGAALTVLIEQGEPVGPVSLRCAGTPDLPHEDGVGPRIEGDA